MKTKLLFWALVAIALGACTNENENFPSDSGLCDEIPGSGRKSTRRGGAIDDLTFRDTITDGGCRK